MCGARVLVSLVVAVGVTVGWGCRSAAPAGQAANERHAPAAVVPTATVQSYGAPLSTAADTEHDLAKLLGDPDAYADARVTVQGVVRQVCQRRGCWLELASDASADAPGCRVVSEHHDFVVPRDSVGSRARVEGTLQVRTVAAEQVAHMESEGGQFKHKHADGTAREVRITARGVELTPAAR